MNKVNFNFITGYSNGGFVTQTKPSSPTFEDWYDKNYSIWEQDEVTKAFKFTKAEEFSLLKPEEQREIRKIYDELYGGPILMFSGISNSYVANTKINKTIL